MEHSYINRVGETHRKRLGQFFTHPSIAKFMVRWVAEADASNSDFNPTGRTIFDPAFGLGAFRKQIPQNWRDAFSAMEVDPEIINFWHQTTGEPLNFLTLGDYLLSWGQTHHNIVCNPPYMRFQKFAKRVAVLKSLEKHLGEKVSGYTNTASAFLLKSISELDEAGRLAYIMPLEFLNTGYGTLVKQQLLRNQHLCAIISFDCEREIFPDVTTSVGIILFDKSSKYEKVRFYTLNNVNEINNLANVCPTSIIDHAKLKPDNKWLPYFQTQTFSFDKNKTIPLLSYGRFSRGIATGANEFFVLNQSKVKSLELDKGLDYIPCITRSSQIASPFFDDKDLKRLQDNNKPVFLFYGNGSHSPMAKAYIQKGITQGYHKRYLTRNRNPWYKTETRQPAPLLMGVFSRGSYKIIQNTSQAVNLTCYHGFQPNRFGSYYIDRLFLYLSSETGREIVSLSMRKYGDSLDKFEPNDINNSLVPTSDFFDQLPESQVSKALKAYRETSNIPNWLQDFFAELRSV